MTNTQPKVSESANLKDALSGGLGLPASAVAWLGDMYDVAQLFDDIADGDPVEREDLNRVIWITMVGAHTNEFFVKNSQTLLPVLATAVFKWQASDQAERQGKADEVSFVYRAGFYDLVMIAYFLCHGREATEANAALIMSLYGEKYTDYKKEFK